jgi:hypothetical protein
MVRDLIGDRFGLRALIGDSKSCDEGIFVGEPRQETGLVKTVTISHALGFSALRDVDAVLLGVGSVERCCPDTRVPSIGMADDVR